MLFVPQASSQKKKMSPYDTNYGNCPYCGAPRVQNPRTGKIFCSEKCWLKAKTPNQSYPTTTNPINASQNANSAQIEALQTKVDDLTKKVNEMAHAIHALKVVLINGDKDRENAYELHRIPLVEKEPKEEIPEDPDKIDLNKYF